MGKEEVIPLAGVFDETRRSTSITISFQTDSYEIAFNEGEKHQFSKRITKEAVLLRYKADTAFSFFSESLWVGYEAPETPLIVKPPLSSDSYESKFFQLSAAAVARDSWNYPYDYIIIGSGIGGGVLATDLLAKNKLLAGTTPAFTSDSTEWKGGMHGIMKYVDLGTDLGDRSLKILVIERGGLVFNTHSLNMPQPSSRANYGQMNDLFYHRFIGKWEMDKNTEKR